MRRLTGYGLRLASQLPVPGAVADAGEGPPDVTITLDPPGPTDDAPVYARTQDGLCFVCPGVASYRIADRSIAIAPDPAAPAGMVSDMLVATALPAWLWLRERFVLHAGAVRLPGGGAVAVAGASGSGKSTVLAHLADAGAALIGDDTIAFAHDSATVATGLAGGWFATHERAAERVFVTADRSTESAAIAAILVLDARGDAPASFARIERVAAVAQLLAHRHRPRVPDFLGRQVDTLRHAALLAGAIPLYSWRRRTGAAALTPTEWAVLERIGTGREIE